MTSSKDILSPIERHYFLIRAQSESLAAQVVIYRLLGIRRDFSSYCMAELYRRKVILGDDFNYEEYISKELNDSPKSQLDPKQRNAFFSMIKNKVIT